MIKSILDLDIEDLHKKIALTVAELKYAKISEPIPYHDRLGRKLNINDYVLYPDQEDGIRLGKIIKFDQSGLNMAITYVDDGTDCIKLSTGEIVTREEVWKSLYIDPTDFFNCVLNIIKEN